MIGFFRYGTRGVYCFVVYIQSSSLYKAVDEYGSRVIAFIGQRRCKVEVLTNNVSGPSLDCEWSFKAPDNESVRSTQTKGRRKEIFQH